MGKKDQEQLWFEEFERVQKEISKIGLFRNGSITKRWQTCGNSKCMCKKDKEYRPGLITGGQQKKKQKQ